MVVDNMTYEDVINEYIKDLPEVNNKIHTYHEYNRKKERRFMIKHKPQTLQTIFRFNYLTKNHNTFVLEAFTYNYAYWKKERCMLAMSMDFHYHGGRNLIFNAHGDTDLVWITPHFIQRYNERFLHSNGGDVAFTFLDRNNESFSMINTQENYDNSSFCTVNDGVILTQEIMPRVTCLKTFLSREMLKSIQIDKDKLLMKELNEYYKNECEYINRA